MAGRWMTAGNRTALYRADVPGARGNGVVGNFAARAVLRELCAIAHDAGVAHIPTASLRERLGLSDRHVRRALTRLERDGWITRPVRGVGNRVGVEPRASVYVLRPLPDANGQLWPKPEWVGQQWPAYAQTPRFLHLSRGNRAAVRMAAQAALVPVENPPDDIQQPDSLSQQPDSPVRPITRKQEEQEPARPHPRVTARRRRGRLTVIEPTRPGHPSGP